MKKISSNLQNLSNAVTNAIGECAVDTCSNKEVEFDPDLAYYLRKLGMPWSKVGQVFGVSRQTIYKWRVKHSIMEPNSTIDDDDLKSFLLEKVHEQPNAGVGLMHSALLAAGYRASRKRVWKCLQSIDPIGIFCRRKKRVTRRVYKVKGANYLWHMDSNHKLIMYKFVVHGCTDGFSRRALYLNVANNNKAATVLAMFKTAVSSNLLPKRVRGDRGKENEMVKEYMQRKSSVKTPFIYGRSVHNTRIERLWRDVNIQVISVFKYIFESLEDAGVLDQLNNLDLFCLHYVFTSRIQESLQNFMVNWNNHTMRTMKSRTPNQQWAISIHRQGINSVSHVLEENSSDNDSNSDSEISPLDCALLSAFSQ